MQTKHPQSSPLFSLGSVVATRGVFDHLTANLFDAKSFLQRHQYGDWGDVPPEDAAENDFAVKNSLRIFSSYQMAGKRVWVITEADRSVTTLLFPCEY
ncbi:MAG: type I restriction endonuclease subunit M [Vogesella sp.]|uniref:type I restriction endonuclease subunit M n=1 Tax=Vogesella sp. TaxID=1904252 RepID=UPI003918C554